MLQHRNRLQRLTDETGAWERQHFLDSWVRTENSPVLIERQQSLSRITGSKLAEAFQYGETRRGLLLPDRPFNHCPGLKAKVIDSRVSQRVVSADADSAANLTFGGVVNRGCHTRPVLHGQQVIFLPGDLYRQTRVDTGRQRVTASGLLIPVRAGDGRNSFGASYSLVTATDREHPASTVNQGDELVRFSKELGQERNNFFCTGEPVFSQ